MLKFCLGHRWSPPRGFGEQGNKQIYLRGTGEQRPNFEGNRGTKTILGNREHKKTNFRFLGNRGTSQFISGEQEIRYPLGAPPRYQARLWGIFAPNQCFIEYAVLKGSGVLLPVCDQGWSPVAKMVLWYFKGLKWRHATKHFCIFLQKSNQIL